VQFVAHHWQDPNGTGIPNVLLGWPFLEAPSMMMMGCRPEGGE